MGLRARKPDMHVSMDTSSGSYLEPATRAMAGFGRVVKYGRWAYMQSFRPIEGMNTWMPKTDAATY